MNNYQFLKKTPELVAQRRVGLDWHANVAQISQFTLHIFLIPVLEWLASAQVKRYSRQPPQKGGGVVLDRTSRGVKFTLGTDVVKGYGTYGQWIFGIAWTAWLGFLCFDETAPDYLHLTKRFGLVAASQLPIHYLLATTRPGSPFQVLLRSPFRLNMALHKVTGKIIITFFALHVSMFCYFFVQVGMFWKSIQEPYLIVAAVSAGILAVLGSTSTQAFRRSNYRWFYRAHAVGFVAVLPLLYFHVSHIRMYLIESGAVLVVNAVVRKLNS